MAPSPELGQPKAPDKTVSSSTAVLSTTTSLSSSSSTSSSAFLSSGMVSNYENSSNTLSATTTTTPLPSSSLASPCYHQYTTSTSMTNTTTTQALSGTLVSTGTVFGSSSLSSANSTNPSSNSNTVTSAIATSSNVESSSKDINEWEDNELKELLDEAYSYKNPKDRENKSETFRQLLHKVECEKEDIPFSFRAITTRYTRGSNSHKHGGSLQDLFEAAQNDTLLDCEYGSYGTRNRRHHHNSRPKKYSTVSSRQREGGSLPSNVNASNCNLSVYEQPFLNEVNNKKRGKTERTVSGASFTSGTSATSSTVSTGGYESLNSSSTSQTKEDTHFTIAAPGDTIIDIGDNFAEEAHHLAQDTLAQGIPEPLDYEDGIELPIVSKKIPRHPVNAMSTHGKLEITCTEPRSWVDETISFPTLERAKNVDKSCLSIDETYKCYNSVLGSDNKSADTIKTSSSVFGQNKIPSTSKQLDENGNPLNPTSYNNTSSQSQGKAKKKKSQSDRNTTILNIQSVTGYRGRDTVEELLKFIENTDSKKSEKNGKQEGKKKEKKKDKEKEKEKEKDKDKDKEKEDKKKIKRSNSLEELRSCTKLDEDEKTESHVTMRSKGKKNVEKTSVSVTDGKENMKQQQNHNKRGERRSWGTEELNYLGENNAIEEVREKAKEKEKTKKSKDSKEPKESKELKEFKENKETKDTKDIKESIEKSEKPEELEKLEKSEKNEHGKKKKDESMESVQSESAEFHVVTKKKKAKKRQGNVDCSSSTSGSITNQKSSTISMVTNRNDNNSFGSKRYHTSSHFTNDRDVYLNSLHANESRRKSTSSVPPSEKSDSSDLDSVHSLPIESSSSRHINHSSITTTIAAASASLTSTNQIQPQSYADIARIVNLNKASASAQSIVTSPPTEKIDKWPSVSAHSTGSIVSNPIEGNRSIAVTGRSGSLTSKKSHGRDFPDLISDKSYNQNNDAGSSCSSTSSTSTIVKQVTYSQSLGEEKYVNDIKSPPSKSSKPTEVAKSNDVISRQQQLQQALQKSKSVETETYCNIEQYPALEKTVKKHTQQNNVVSGSNSSMPVNPSQTYSITGNPKQQRSASLQSSNSANHLLNAAIVTGSISNQSNNPNPNTLSSSVASIPNVSHQQHQQHQQQQQQLPIQQSLSDNKSKVVVNHSVDINMNSNSNLISTSSPSNLSNMNMNNNNNINSGNVNAINTANNPKRSNKQQQQNNNNNNNVNKVNSVEVAAVANTITSHVTQAQQTNVNLPLVEINNAKNKQQQQINQITATNPEVIDTNVNNRKSKSEGLQTSVTGGRKSKKDKNNQNAGLVNSNNNIGITANTNAATITTDLQQFPPLISSNMNTNPNPNKHSNRPAVIILNDVNDSSMPIVNDFTFGDFNEEELRLFENHLPLDDSGQFNMTLYQDNAIMTNPPHPSFTTDTAMIYENATNLSPHGSDHGYSSSSNNRSVLSESIDGGNGNGNGPIISSSSSCAVMANSVQTDQQDILLQGTMNIVESNQQVQSLMQDGAASGYYIEKICNPLPNCVNTQTQTVYYHQQSQPPPPQHQHQHQQQQMGQAHHQQQTILTNLGTNVVAVPVAGGNVSIPVQTPINLQNSSLSNCNSDLNTNSYSTNSDTKIIGIVNCKCAKNNNSNDINKNSNNGKQTTVVVSVLETVNNYHATVTIGGSSNVTVNNANNTSLDNINNNIIILSNADGSCQQSQLQQQQQQQQQQQEIIATALESNSKCSNSSNNIGNSNEQALDNSTISSPTSSSSKSSLLSSSLGKASNVTDAVTAVASSVSLIESNNEISSPSAVTVTATPTPSPIVIPDNDGNNTNWGDSNKKLAKKEINVRFVAPPIAHELNSLIHERIVDFVGLAWQEISGTNRGAQFYNGQ